jgi:hypothetical protein
MENQDECCYYGWRDAKFSGVINIEAVKSVLVAQKLMQ